MQGSLASLAAPMLSRVARAAETLKIGMVLPVTGPAAAVGGYALAGAKIALDRVNKSGGVLGKQLELITEDDQTTNPGAVLAFSKLASQPDIVAFLGPVRSTQNHAIANDILKTAKPFCFGGTDPALTKMGNPWMIRFRPNDSYSGRVIASYGVGDPRQEELGARPLHRRFRHERQQPLGRLDRQAWRQGRHRSGLPKPEPGFHAGRARH